ncbi:acetolactate synthase I/II/III large subunit [Sphaerisporangium krabiense]|uniref:Thiamine pyrophosphate-dependent acetolactate synthase large subunit-like protein n=1 Tax=Sphaerisporangium krabiense TaxID=763782 RepID=A0A7W9DTW1_9ACTN|nr:thiamine pyrophosphate-binding protein [Sphaerisporangium krabiense]MBB5631056.1 thiamine pyrophosphate-dependent acetolactate synthase large subunit-like protein [Sphaerisporangium krabiense]GII65939.1 acetolactate synthase I/II/III large subunit [Sphaerisporangium krabiense]
MPLVLEAMGRALRDLGVPVMFGLPGSGNYELVHAARAAGVAYHGANHEAGAVGMADGWARVTGATGLAMLSQGPGLTNGLTALTEAVKSGTPLVVVVIDTPRSSLHGNLNIDQTAVVTALGAGATTVRSAATAVDDLRRSLRRAAVERRPVVLMVPLDLVHAEVPRDAAVREGIAPPSAPWPDPEAVAEAAKLVRSAARPVVLGGRGAVRAGAREELLALAGRIGALLTVSAPAKGLFAGAEFDLGVSGSFASPLAADLLAEADLVLAFGAGLNAWTTGNDRMPPPGVPVVQVDADPRAIGAHRPVAVAIQADARVAARALHEELGPGDRPGFRTEAVAARIRGHDPAREFTPADGVRGLDPRVFTLALDRILPSERTVTIDSGHFMGWPAKYLSAPDAAGFLYPQAFQCVGLGLGNAIGAAVARPDRISVLAVGDGGMMLSPQELDTAVRHGLPLLVVVYDDSAYGAEVHRFEPIGLAVDLVRFPDRDFAGMARSAGARGITVRAVEDLEELRGWLGDPRGPMVLDVKIDPTVIGGWVAGNSKAALA